MESWQNGYCTGLENRRPQGLGGSNPSLSAFLRIRKQGGAQLMKEDTRKRLAKLILEELSDKIKGNEVLGRKLESFTDLPVEKVADAILKQFEYLLSSELRDLIVHLIEQEVASETAKAETVEQIETPPDNEKPVLDKSNVRTPEEFIAEETHSQKDVIQPVQFSTESVMEHFGVKEPFPTQPMDIPLSPDDWFYLIAFSYAPDSAGKGVPSTKLGLKGIDNRNEIFLLDYGDVRLYMNKLIADDFSRNKTGEPLLSTTAAAPFKFTHEKILNVLRTQEVLVPLPFWSVIQGHENIIKLIEDRYVELLRALIDVHDAMEMDVEVFASDVHIASLAEISGASKGRT